MYDRIELRRLSQPTLINIILELQKEQEQKQKQESSNPLTQIKVLGRVEETCSACPIIFEFKDTKGNSYYFRLRGGGGWYLCNETTDSIVVSGPALYDCDGFCSWEQAKGMILSQGIVIID